MNNDNPNRSIKPSGEKSAETMRSAFETRGDKTFKAAIEAGHAAWQAGLGRVLERGAAASDPLTTYERAMPTARRGCCAAVRPRPRAGIEQGSRPPKGRA